METFTIKGGNRLKGEVVPQGAKNEALQVLCASILTKEKVRIKNIPEIKDVQKMMSLLAHIGVKIQKNAKGDYSFQADDLDKDYFRKEDFKKDATAIRGSIMLVAPLLLRFKEAYIPKPGGDKIGRRRLDTHFQALISFGSTFQYNLNSQYYKLKLDTFTGRSILLEEPSITGTASTIMVASMAKGKTVIYNAACEPYIKQLCRMLIKMGAKIEGVGSNLLTIQGVEELGGCEHELLPDMIEVGSWMGLCAITRSEITIKNVSWENLGIIPSTFQKLGIYFEKRNDDIYIPSQENYKIERFIDGSFLTISDGPWPGLTPDLLSILLVVSIQAKGSVLIHQKMYESRLFFVDKLIDMGAQIILCDPHRATIIGLNQNYPLRGTMVSSPDIRAGVALLIACLSAEGESTIHNIDQIDRGYETIEERLRAIGADIVRGSAK